MKNATAMPRSGTTAASGWLRQAYRDEWKVGWPVIVAGFLSMTVYCLHVGALSVLMKPMSEATGWSRSQISSAQFIIVTCLLFLAPVMSHLLPRVGVAKIALSGLVGYGTGLVLIGASGPSIWTFYAAALCTGIFFANLSAAIWATIVNRLFFVTRGAALAVTMSGVGFGSFLSPAVSIVALDHFGWRGPFIALGAISILVMFPLVWWMLALSDAKSGYRIERDPQARAEGGFGLRKAAQMLDPVFLKITASSILVAAATGTLILHFQAILRDSGVGAEQAAFFGIIIGPSIIVGRILSGLMLDHVGPRLVATLWFTLPGIVCAGLLFYQGSMAGGVILSIMFGMAYGAENDILAYMLSRYFRAADYSFLYAVSLGIYAFAFGLSPVLGGALHEMLGSYETMLIGMTGLVALSVLFVCLIGKPLPLREEGEAATARA